VKQQQKTSSLNGKTTYLQLKDTSTTTIIKGVPLDADDKEVLDDIQHQFPDSELERLYKQGKKASRNSG
jgi:hypothetical protein